jgi:Fic family protein
LQLMKDGVLRDPLLIVSPWFEARRKEYQDELLAVSQTGAFDPWIRFFCSGLEAQAIATVEKVEQLLGYQEELRSLIRSIPLRGAARSIAEDLIGEPITSASTGAKRYGVSFQAANGAIARLVEAGLLSEITGRAYGRVFASQRVMSILMR